VNRYKKKVVLNEEAKGYILPFDRPDRKKPGQPGTAPEKARPLDIAPLFGNPHPVEIEVGFGTGRFLIPYALKYPGLNLLGLEITRKMVDHVANQVQANSLTNVRIVHCDARIFMRDHLPDASVDRVHVYFPDPWIKKRHIKRRIINQDFLATAFRVLKEGGRLNLFTDHKDYFDYFLSEKEMFGKFLYDVDPGDYTPTSYETKWVRQGRTIYRAILRKPLGREKA
jgi:tRNA (guanine-N7-)-methyltransferase